jgi:hypothetical protein
VSLRWPGDIAFTAAGWLAALEACGASGTEEYQERLGRILAAMKRHVKGRREPAVVELRQLASESREPEGLIFNVIDSGASTSTRSERTGATWYRNERGRLVEIPVDFNLEPIDIVTALTVGHLKRIEELEARLEEVEEDRAQFHCPHCDAPVSSIGYQDYPEHHCIVTYHSYGCGYVTGDGFEESPCPYGPNWPDVEEFDFVTKQAGSLWICDAVAKTQRARKTSINRATGRTKDEAEMLSRRAASRKKKGGKRLPDWLNP